MKESTFSFDGFEPANTTPVPDILFDRLLSKLNGAELKVLLYIIRRTRGFKKDTDAISLSQFTDGITTREGKVLDHGCGIKNRTIVSHALARLEAIGCIKSTKSDDPLGDKATTLYSICFRGSIESVLPSNKTVLPVVSETHHGSNQSVPGVVSKSYPQETVLQDTDKQQTETQEESTGEQSDTATSASSLPFDASLSLSDTHSKLGDAHGSADNDMVDMALDHAQHLPSVPDCHPDEQAQVAEAAPVIDEEWCNAETEHRLPAIPKSPPGGTSHEQNRDASPRNVAVEATPRSASSVPIPPVPPEVSPSRTIRATVVPAPPKWNAQAMLARAEVLRDKPFSESARPKETKAARKLFARKPDLTEEEFTSAFQHWNTPWWHETNGPFCITDLAAVPKNKSEMRLIIALEKLAMPKKPPGGQVIQMPTTRGQQWRSSFDDPDYDMSAEFYPGTVAR